MASNPFGRVQSRPLAILLGVVLSLGFAHAAVAADELPREATLPLALASKAAAAAQDKCKQDGHRVTVAVVDRSGVLKVLMRGDGAGPHTTDSSTKKAYTAASLRRPTSEFAEMVAKIPSLQGLRDMNDKILILGGGLPIEIGGEVVGGIGVGGAPGGHLDDACAQAGLDSIGAVPKAPPAK
ncbi:MAG: heme-binding protein [Nitrospiraceae bacterium]|nr:MAG: heme-binding protein [Nitrospiraceae bacterium]